MSITKRDDFILVDFLTQVLPSGDLRVRLYRTLKVKWVIHLFFSTFFTSKLDIKQVILWKSNLPLLLFKIVVGTATILGLTLLVDSSVTLIAPIFTVLSLWASLLFIVVAIITCRKISHLLDSTDDLIEKIQFQYENILKEDRELDSGLLKATQCFISVYDVKSQFFNFYYFPTNIKDWTKLVTALYFILIMLEQLKVTSVK